VPWRHIRITIQSERFRNISNCFGVIRAKHRLTDALWREFHALKLLMRQVDQAMHCKVKTISFLKRSSSKPDTGIEKGVSE
jgi:hypothetical protein